MRGVIELVRVRSPCSCGSEINFTSVNDILREANVTAKEAFMWPSVEYETGRALPLIVC